MQQKSFAYASVEPLQLKRKCNLNVCIPQTKKSLKAEFYVTQGKAATLLGRDASELLGVLRVGIPVNNCDVNPDSSSANAPQANKKASLRARIPKSSRAWENSGSINYETVRPVAQPVRKIPFSRREKVRKIR